MEGGPLHPRRSRLDVEGSVLLRGLEKHGSTPTF